MPRLWKRFEDPAERRLALAMLILVPACACAAALHNGFAFDDGPIIADDPRIHSLHGWWRLFASTYWPPQFGASLYRPIATLGFAVQWAIGGGAPWVFHLASLALYAAVCVAVLALFLELLPEAPAAAGAALFAAHPVHVEAVANVVGQAELIVALALVRAATYYLRARRAGGAPSRPTVARIAALFAVGLLAKEHAAVLPLLIVAIELLAPIPASTWRERARALAPALSTLAVVLAGYLVVRRIVVGSLVGEQSFVAMDAATRAWTFLRVVPEWARLLLWPAHLSADYSPPGLPVVHAWEMALAPGLALACGVVLVVALARRRAPAAALGVAWTALALAPVSNLLAVTGILLAERTLFLPSVGAMLAAGWVVQWMAARVARAEGERPTSEDRTRTASPALAWALVALLAGAGVVRSIERAGVWRDDATLFARTALDAPMSYRAQYLYGQSLFAAGDRAEGERRLRLAIRLDPVAADVDPLNYLATQYRSAGLCAPALPLYREAVARAPRRPDARFGLAACLLATGDARGAREHAAAGLRAGMGLGASFRAVAASADSVLARSR
jgi:tetratricopeptide (TPR) repeat protein